MTSPVVQGTVVQASVVQVTNEDAAVHPATIQATVIGVEENNAVGENNAVQHYAVQQDGAGLPGDPAYPVQEGQLPIATGVVLHHPQGAATDCNPPPMLIINSPRMVGIAFIISAINALNCLQSLVREHLLKEKKDEDDEESFENRFNKIWQSICVVYWVFEAIFLLRITMNNEEMRKRMLREQWCLGHFIITALALLDTWVLPVFADSEMRGTDWLAGFHCAMILVVLSRLKRTYGTRMGCLRSLRARS